jgi:hypothetical protein
MTSLGTFAQLVMMASTFLLFASSASEAASCFPFSATTNSIPAAERISRSILRSGQA